MKPISTPDAPAAIGPYSQAIVHEGVVYCSGQIALDPATGLIVGTDVAAQTEQVLSNLQAVLLAAGSDLSQVIKTGVFLRDMADFAEMNAVYAEAFGGAPPARATIGVAALPAAARVEIEAVAVIGGPA